jgi:hypothetical protein
VSKCYKRKVEPEKKKWSAAWFEAQGLQHSACAAGKSPLMAQKRTLHDEEIK